jgi:hypothetical protein
MKRNIIWLIVLVVVLLGILVVAKNLKEPADPEGFLGVEPSFELVSFFESTMIAGAIADIDRAIEGYDDNLLRISYPGLESRDFQGVQAFGGRYKVSGDNGPAFIRDSSDPTTSAERTISSEGYKTLLRNVSNRLGIVVNSQDDVLHIIKRINTAERVRVSINQSATFLGIQVTPMKLVQDSRCPIEAMCAQAGTVQVETSITSLTGESGIKIYTFSIGQTIEVDGHSVTFERVDPIMTSTKILSPADYIFYFEIRAL